MIIRNWRDSIPYVGHESKIIWPILTRTGSEHADPPETACLLGLFESFFQLRHWLLDNAVSWLCA